MKQAPILRTRRIAVHTILGAYTLVAILPVLLVIMNSFKDRNRSSRIRWCRPAPAPSA